MNGEREDSPTDRSETISKTSGEMPRHRTDRRQPPASDDLVSVDRHGNVTVESGSGAGRAHLLGAEESAAGTGNHQNLPPDP